MCDRRERGRFERAARSRAVPELDPLLAAAMEVASQTRALRWLHERVRARRERRGDGSA